MKTLLKILKWTGIAIPVVILVFVLGVFIRQNRTFDAPYPDITASTDSTLIARGKYLVYGPAHCAHCHAPVFELERTERGEEVPLDGGFEFVLPVATIVTPNITTDLLTGIGAVSDQEIARSLRYGVGRDGRALFDFMPFYDLSDEDLTAIISYLRTQEPVYIKRPESSYSFVGKALKAFVIKPMGDGEVPSPVPPGETLEYGKYLAESVANCKGCHTERNLMTGAFIGTDYTGNMAFEIVNKGKIVQGKHIVAPNLTPDPETGVMAGWSEGDFIARFRAGRIIPGTPMPWGPFSRLTDLELKAMYKYLRSLEPVKQFSPTGIQDGDPSF